MNKQSHLVVITIVETCVVFVLGVAGNKIAELVEIKPIVLVVATCVLLALAIILTLLRARAAPSPSIDTREKGISRRLIPRTMISIFPVGMLLGLVGGSLLSAFFDLHAVLATGPFSSLIIGPLFAILVDGYLAGALIVGYGLGFLAATLVIKSVQYSFETFKLYVVYVIFPVIFGHLLWKLDPIWRQIREFVTKERL